MQIDLQGKTAVVTGAGIGIGRAVAVELGRCGAQVIVNYRHNADGAQQTLDLVRKAGGDGQIVMADVSQADQVEKLMRASVVAAGRIDILMNNAGGLVKRAKID